MKIVVLDGAVMNPGDFDWGKLSRFGEYSCYDRTPAACTVERCRGAALAVTNKVIFDAAVMDQLPELRYIGVSSTGYNVVDTAAAAARGIVVTNVPAYGTQAVAQLTFALLLHIANRVSLHTDSVRAGEWSAAGNFCYWLTEQVELAGKRIGLYGFGEIGRAVAGIAAAFGMEVLAYRRRGAIEFPGVRFVGAEELFCTSDIVSLHCPLAPDTMELIDAAALEKFKDGAWLINTARGALVNESAVAQALAAGKLGAYAADVLCVEPPPADHPLLSAPNCYITPHMAWAARAARERLFNTVIANIAAFVQGTPQNQVS